MLATNSGRGFVNSDGCARTAFAAPAGQSCWAKHWSPRMSTSFAEKRKAAEKARRLAKKAKALAADDGIIAAPVASMPQVASVTLDWQPVQLISGTVPQTSPLPESSLLPGTLHEHVQMTPALLVAVDPTPSSIHHPQEQLVSSSTARRTPHCCSVSMDLPGHLGGSTSCASI